MLVGITIWYDFTPYCLLFLFTYWYETNMYMLYLLNRRVHGTIDECHRPRCPCRSWADRAASAGDPPDTSRMSNRVDRLSALHLWTFSLLLYIDEPPYCIKCTVGVVLINLCSKCISDFDVLFYLSMCIRSALCIQLAGFDRSIVNPNVLGCC